MQRFNLLDTIFESEEIWSQDAEDAFLEAIQRYSIDGPKMIKKNGQKFDQTFRSMWKPNVFAESSRTLAVLIGVVEKVETIMLTKDKGRNQLISKHILKRCGKEKTTSQISSHIQMYKIKRKQEGRAKTYIKRPVILNYLVHLTPAYSQDNLISLTSNGYVKLNQIKEAHGAVNCFTDIENLITNMYDLLHIRKISSNKLGLIAMLTYAHEKTNSCNTIMRWYTCITEYKMPKVCIEDYYQFYDKDLINLFEKGPTDAFYLVKSFINVLDYSSFYDKSSVNYVWSQTFYSSYLMEIEMVAKIYIFGKIVYELKIDNLAIDEACDCATNQKYFIYHLNFPQPIPFIQSFVWTHLKNLNLHDHIGLLRTIMKNQSNLIVLRDKHTKETLLVIASVNYYHPNFTAYRFHKIVHQM